MNLFKPKVALSAAAPVLYCHETSTVTLKQWYHLLGFMLRMSHYTLMASAEGVNSEERLDAKNCKRAST